MNNIKLVILAGGYGTRFSEETNLKPKPMIEIGGKPILWHIMKIYSFYGINEFIVCCGHKGQLIKEYFHNYALNSSDLVINLKNNNLELKNKNYDPWKITLVDTGEDTMTCGRIKRIKNLIKNEKFFCVTYGDGLSNVNINKLIKFHLTQKKLATLTACFPPPRFGAIKINNNFSVSSFKEKARETNSFVNGGFFVLSPEVIKLIKNDKTKWEEYPLKKLSEINQLVAFKHTDFWQPMDTINDRKKLEDLWLLKNCPWRIW